MSTGAVLTPPCSPISEPGDEYRSRHFRLPAQRRRIRGHSPRGDAGGLLRHRRGQYLRGDDRSGPSGAAGDSGASPPQTEPQAFAAMPETDCVIGNGEKLSSAGWTQARAAFDIDGAAKTIVNDIMAVKETAPHLVDTFSGRARAFVQVQNGCDHRCTFCIIPFGRGNSRSVPMGAVVEDVRRLVANGYCEVVLTGVDITSYGGDLPGAPKLGALVKQVLKHVPELQRLRLSSIDSVEADRELLAAIAGEPRL